jgi:thiamine-monophosphate kinase
LFAAAHEHDVELVGGDTTSGEVVVATVHMTGVVDEGAALLRSGAQVGDSIFVTGTVGDDLSDGLVGDLRKLLDASGVGAEIDIERIPMSEALRQRFNTEEALEFALTGGDDYELLFTGPADIDDDDVTPIGVVTPGTELRCWPSASAPDLLHSLRALSARFRA